MLLSDLEKLEDAFKDILFVESNHTYTFNGQPAKSSVTQLLKYYQKPFDAPFFAKRTALKNGMSEQEVLDMWEFNKNYSCHKGTSFHSFAENYLHRKQVPLDRAEIVSFCKQNNWVIEDYYKDVAKYIKNFYEFYTEWKKGYCLVKTEFVIGDLDLKVGGTIDNLSYDKINKKLVLFDYKTNKSIESKNKYNAKLLHDLEHLSDCELVKYSLQMWIYAVMLQKHTDVEVDAGFIVWVGGDKAEVIPVLSLRDEANMILAKSALR